jgi:hypothetical protein
VGRSVFEELGLAPFQPLDVRADLAFPGLQRLEDLRVSRFCAYTIPIAVRDGVTRAARREVLTFRCSEFKSNSVNPVDGGSEKARSLLKVVRQLFDRPLNWNRFVSKVVERKGRICSPFATSAGSGAGGLDMTSENWGKLRRMGLLGSILAREVGDSLYN